MSIPSVTTYNPYSVLTTSAELGGNVTSDGGDTIIDRGIVYSSVDSTPIIGEAGVSQISNGTGTGEFNVSLSLLTEDTTYYAQAYTINSVGTAYGGVISFTTLYDATQDNLDIAEVKAAIEGTTFSATQAAAGSSEMALSKAQSLVNMLNLRGCTAIVEAETYNAAIAGTSVDKDGTDGYCTFTVKISKGRGTLQVSNIKTMTIIAETYKNDNYTGGGSAANSTNSSVIVNGKVVSAGTIANTKVDGKKISTISIDEQRLEQILAEEKINPVITIPVSTEADVIIAELNGRMIRNMENKKATIEVKTDVASYVLPAMQINIESISKQINKNVELKDILVRIEISKPTNEEAKLVENSSVRGGFTIVAPAVEFNITCTHGDKTIKLDKFSSFVERTIAIPEGVNPSKITTGIIINNDGTFRHVPTKIVVIDGRYYAKINSLTNSLYSVIWNPIEFTDVSNHWSKEAVNDMGSRMIINGVGDKMYEPDRYITRAEFAAIAVKSLGLKPGTGENKFDDIKSTDWYCPYIETASEYGIISGFGNGNFGPNDKITREQAMTMIARAMKITGLEYELNSYDTELTFSEFEDSAEFSEWAVESMVKCVKTGIVTGKGANTIAPKDQITRAEVAVIIQRLLKASNLI
ncbi:S-layer homology domain-containing protein [Sedimentibacter saalensis]|uniref:S-layer homology domain-containing protein n=1 Tax=Sedimentibacter saalensis TaxID=130788 RepID=UPI002896B0F2|nr:S-layer homology domain-containing protein [Sedimentibacter saalensis]